MTKSERETRVAVATGDVTMDWHLARLRRAQGSAATWNPYDWARLNWQRGGAALLADLAEAILATLPAGAPSWRLLQTGAPREPVRPGDERFHHSYATWSPHKYGERPPLDREKPAWRLDEHLGVDRSSQAAAGAASWQAVAGDEPEPDLVILDDANLGFRDRPELWPRALAESRGEPWILVRTAWPVAQGALWEHLSRRPGRRLIVVTTVEDLRRSEVQISRGLSWERTAQDVAWELVYNPRVNALSRAMYLVLSFDTSGAMLLARREAPGEAAGRVAPPACTLFYDPQGSEGAWVQDYPGRMIGYTTCLAGGLLRQILLLPERPDIARGTQSGLAVMRRLHQEGYGDRNAPPAQVPLAFPHALVAAELARDGAPFAVTEVQDPGRFLLGPVDVKGQESGWWTILNDRYAGTLGQVARQIVLEGAEAALQGVPLGRFGALLTVDRREIESFQSIRALVDEYCRRLPQKRPLSIAVFGPPGSGKSFGITQVARALLPGRIETLEFNLSQFSSADDLVDALHRVRDVGLSGKIPLVFWDEFDTPLAGRRLGWLRYFLAPMQDGAFQQGQAVHPIGGAIFVFAGGTCRRLDEFGQALEVDEFRAAKGPDFASRLKGYVNVLGPDPQQGADDPHYAIRRAILLRSVLQRSAPQLVQRAQGKEVLSIDPGVLRAFLAIPTYRHGVRSMEAIVAMSMLAGKTAYERSSLPSEAQLDLHVDGRRFLALVQQIDLEGELLEKLAEAAHDVFCEEVAAQGYHWGPSTDERLKTHSALVPYGELAPEEQELNRGAVRDIPHKLALAGYIMVPARSNEKPFEFPGPELERLARLEHERWVQARLVAGWRHGPVTDRQNKVHESLVAWEELPEGQKEKDRVLVREIPRILARAGYAVVRLSPAETQHSCAG